MIQIQQLVGDKELFYKGNYGIVCDGLFLRRGDANNNLYSSSKTIFSSSAKDVDQLVYIDNPLAPKAQLMNLDNFQMPKDLNST